MGSYTKIFKKGLYISDKVEAEGILSVDKWIEQLSQDKNNYKNNSRHEGNSADTLK